MEKIKACVTAFAIFLVLAFGLHLVVENVTQKPDERLGTWTGEAKFRSASVMAQNMDKDTLLVCGSSELEHGKDTDYQLINVFSGQEQKLMVLGAGYYQSLYHATAVAAMEGDMENRKVVLILSPQWFRKSGVKEKAYASRFSEENYVLMLQNPDIDEETRQYISDRTQKLLNIDPQTKERAARYDREYLTDTASAGDKIRNKLYLSFLEEKNHTMITRDLLLDDLASVFRKDKAEKETEGEPDFQMLREAAGEEASKLSSNEFYVTDDYYEKHIVSRLEDVKDEGIKTGYSVSPEYDDLRCFLQVCKQCGIEPLLVMLPVNGYWYDYIGFPQESREDYYGKVRDIAEEFGAETADFSGMEYEKYFMEDTVHIGWKGWVDVSEAIYKFAAGE